MRFCFVLGGTNIVELQQCRARQLPSGAHRERRTADSPHPSARMFGPPILWSRTLENYAVDPSQFCQRSVEHGISAGRSVRSGTVRQEQPVLSERKAVSFTFWGEDPIPAGLVEPVGGRTAAGSRPPPFSRWRGLRPEAFPDRRIRRTHPVSAALGALGHYVRGTRANHDWMFRVIRRVSRPGNRLDFSGSATLDDLARTYSGTTESVRSPLRPCIASSLSKWDFRPVSSEPMPANPSIAFDSCKASARLTGDFFWAAGET